MPEHAANAAHAANGTNGSSAADAGAGAARKVDLSRVKPYADHLGDGLVQFSFTLPVPYSLAARRAALELAAQMGFEQPEVVHYEELTEGYTYFVMYGRCPQTVDFPALQGEGFDIEYMSEDEIEHFAARACRPPDRRRRREHRHGHAQRRHRRDAQPEGLSRPHGLEGYRAFETHNLGSQVPNSVLVAARSSSTPTRSSSRRPSPSRTCTSHNLTELVEIVEAEGRREAVILACGGPRVSNELAKELGYDAGFSKGTYPHHLATFLVRELAAREVAARQTSRAVLSGAASLPDEAPGARRAGEEHGQDRDARGAPARAGAAGRSSG